MAQTVAGGVSTERIKGKNGVPALLARPNAPGTYACVILLHERYGLVKHTEDLAEKLAHSGYTVMAPDLFYAYPDQEALHRGDVGVKPTDAEVVAALDDVVPFFAKTANADPARLGVIGVCQTGRYAIVYGAKRPLQAAVTLYGAAQEKDWTISKETPDGLEPLVAQNSAPVLGIFGERDHVISIDDVLRLRNTLERYNKTYQITIVGDAPHGWLNDTMPGRYRPEAARQTWDEIVAFLDRTLAPGYDRATTTWRFNGIKHADYDFSKNVRME